MQPASNAPLDEEQKVFLGQLNQAVEKINQANGVLSKDHISEMAARDATALSLLAIAKVLVVSEAVKWNMVGRLPAFK